MTVNLTPRVFGSKGKYKKKPKAWGIDDPITKGDRAADPIANDHIKPHYSNTHITRGPDGTSHWHCYADGEEAIEDHAFSGSGVKHTSDGSRMVTVTGNSCEYTKGSHTTTRHGNVDEVTKGQTRQNFDAGHHRSVNGHVQEVITGTSTHFQAQHSGKAHYGLGKGTFNYEGGIGHGVNEGETKYVHMRMFGPGSEMPAGTFYLQIMPTDNPGGIATVKIDPAGNITITGTTMLCDITQTITMKAGSEIVLDSPKMTVKVPKTTWKGNITEKGIHKDSKGEHC